MIDIKLYNNIKNRMLPNKFGSCSRCPVYIAEEFGVSIPNSERCYKKIESLFTRFGNKEISESTYHITGSDHHKSMFCAKFQHWFYDLNLTPSRNCKI
jgi:hypothetical protein